MVKSSSSEVFVSIFLSPEYRGLTLSRENGNEKSLVHLGSLSEKLHLLAVCGGYLSRTRGYQLGRLMPYHLATPACGRYFTTIKNIVIVTED